MSIWLRRCPAALALIALVTTACGPSPEDFNSCTNFSPVDSADEKSITINCTEVAKSLTESSLNEDTCEGVYATVACSTDNSVGNCAVSASLGDGTAVNHVFYASFYSEEVARNECDGYMGTWGGTISSSVSASHVTVTKNTLFSPINLDEKSRP